MGSAAIWGFDNVDSGRQWWAVSTLQGIKYKRRACNRASVPNIGICVLHLSARHNKRLVGSAHPTGNKYKRRACDQASVPDIGICVLHLSARHNERLVGSTHPTRGLRAI